MKISLHVRYAWCVALAAAVLLAGCASGQPGGQPSAAAAARPAAVTTVTHWGSFFGGTPGNVDTRRAPAPVILPGTVAEVGSSNSTEYALLTNGSLYAWGLGTQGQLGNGRLEDSPGQPVRVRFPAGVKIASIPTDAMPFDTGLALDTAGHAWGWGDNGGGELCQGGTREYRTPVRLPFPDVTTMAGASTHALYDAHGMVYACGQNIDGDLGTGYDRRGQLGDGHLGRSSDVPARVRLPHPVAQVAEGGSIWNNGQTLVLLSDGSLWAWGDDHAGQLGNGTRGMEAAPVRFYPPPGVTYQSLSTGSATSYAISTTGQVYAWGVGYEGQLGDGHVSPALVPVLVASGASAISATANNVIINRPARPR